MHEKTDADHVNGPMSPGEAVVSLASPCMSPSAGNLSGIINFFIVKIGMNV